MSLWHQLVDALLAWGPYGLLLLAVLDSVGLPIVGGVDGLLVAIATERPEESYWAAGSAIVGSMAGSLILFFIARKGGEVLLAKYISGRTGARLHTWFQRYGLVTVFVPAISPVPLPMKIPVFCAGALRVRLAYFVFVIGIARVIRYSALAYLGRRYGQFTGRFLLQHGLAIGGCGLAVALLMSIGLRLYQRHNAALGQPE